MAQTNQLPVRPRTDERGNENNRPETQPEALEFPPPRSSWFRVPHSLSVPPQNPSLQLCLSISPPPSINFLLTAFSVYFICYVFRFLVFACPSLSTLPHTVKRLWVVEKRDINIIYYYYYIHFRGFSVVMWWSQAAWHKHACAGACTPSSGYIAALMSKTQTLYIIF